MDDGRLQSKPHPPVQMPVYDAKMQRFQRGQHRVAIDLAGKATKLAVSKLAVPLGDWTTLKRGGADLPAGAQESNPGGPSRAPSAQHQTMPTPGFSTFHAQPAASAPFPALPSQQEFAAALAQGPLQNPAALEQYDPLQHSPQVHSSAFQFMAGAAQSAPLMQPMSVPMQPLMQTRMGGESQPGRPVQAAATKESTEQAASQFTQSLDNQPDTKDRQAAATSRAIQPENNGNPVQASAEAQAPSSAAASAPASGANGTDPEKQALAEFIVWRRRHWVGPSPREHLLEWSIKNQLPRPCYDVMQSSEAPSMFHATCILPHLALQVTPVSPFPAPEDAEQNAALMAIVYIEGGLSEDSAQCRLTRVGQPALPGWTPVQVNSPALPSHAQLVKVLEERMDALRTRQEMLHQEFEVRKVALDKEQDLLKVQQEALLQGGPSAQTIAATLLKELNDPGGPEDGPALKKQRMQAPQVKGPVQELKEFCEKHKWRLPAYEFSSGPEGRGYVCRLTLPDANISGMQSGLQPNQKAAKAEVSADGLKVAHIYAAQHA